MIISASRRTDIPAFYSEWFITRIKEGFVYVRNPMNYHQISKIILSPDIVDGIVFWTKNPSEFITKLDEIKKFNYYFQFTINSYDKSIETNVPSKNQIINTFINLSQKVGKERVVWRYDPIFINNYYNVDYHIKYFEELAKRLRDYTEKCIISFLDFYKNTQRNIKNLDIQQISEKEMGYIATELAAITNKYDLTLETCSEKIDLTNLGIKHGKCIDDKLLSHISGYNIEVGKDKSQRLECGCVTSIDIGSYNTCQHNCLYCYANFSQNTVKKNFEKHNPLSPLLFGDVEVNDNITIRKAESFKSKQIDLFKNNEL